MILVDTSQVLLATLFAQGVKDGINEELVRHVTLSCLRSYKTKYGRKYGRMILCADGRHYWRKDLFPYYKARRKKDREKSGLDWNLIHSCMSQIREEIAENFPYQVIEIPNAEADDIIGHIIHKHHGEDNNNLILSGDKDFPQLQVYKNVDQYAPIAKEWMIADDPKIFLKCHIMRGDFGDGIPNFLSPDDILVRPKGRQTPLSEEKVQQWAKLEPHQFCGFNMMKGWKRNEALVDLSKIPEDISDAIEKQFQSSYNTSGTKIVPYLMKHGMKEHLSHARDFLELKTA